MSFDTERAVKLINEMRVTSAWPWFPSVMQDRLLNDGFDPERLDFLRRIMLIEPEGLLRRVQELFPGALPMNSSGMTEAAASTRCRS